MTVPNPGLGLDQRVAASLEMLDGLAAAPFAGLVGGAHRRGPDLNLGLGQQHAGRTSGREQLTVERWAVLSHGAHDGRSPNPAISATVRASNGRTPRRTTSQNAANP
jgi:hypothetical protein